MLRAALLLAICSSAMALNFSKKKEYYGKMPPVSDAAGMARYIVHNSDWCVLSHITYQRNATGYPMGRVFSTSDGVVGQSTGTPYFYNSDLDAVVRDLKVDNKSALTMSLMEGEYCKKERLDAENPRCAQVMLIGHFIFIQNGTDEWDFAKEALFSRHPEMATWPESHHFQFGKFAISNIQIVDYFGGSKYPSVPEYYNVTLTPDSPDRLQKEKIVNSVYNVHMI